MRWDQLGNLTCSEVDAIVIQTTTEEFLLKLLPMSSASRSCTADEREITLDEKRAIMYAGGYIIRKMKCKVLKDEKLKDGGCYEALLSMVADGDYDEEKMEDYAEYVRSWMEKVD